MADTLERIRRLVRQLEIARAVKPKKLLVTDEEHKAVFFEMLDMDQRPQPPGVTKEHVYDMHSGDVRVLGIQLVRPRDWGRGAFNG